MLSGMARIAIIGGGSIGEALLSGLLRAGRQVKDLVVAERMPDRATYLADTYSVLVTSVTEAVDNATFVVVAVKPVDVESVMGELARAAAAAENDSAEQVYVTVAAGITITYFESRLPAGTPVIRAMPNAAALVGAGVTALAKGRFVTPPQLEEGSALVDAGVAAGLSRPVAADLTVQTMAGSAAMLLERMNQDRPSAEGASLGMQ